ncbi:hypothetical protein ACIBG8_01610 [Nonomuraea sp. NPDC050556]|uniref:hypothetical protein n=1 Tax=Nonomuraea sp. NPDC050556 TaxID=3364369 RepID=UPI00379552C2
MFSLPALFTLLATLVTASIACALTLAASGAWPAALLSGGAVGAATLGTVPRLINKDRPDDEG